MTSVLDEQRNPLESRLIGVGICQIWELSFGVAIGWLISCSIPGLFTKDTHWLLQLESTVVSSTPSQSQVEVDRGWLFA